MTHIYVYHNDETAEQIESFKFILDKAGFSLKAFIFKNINKTSITDLNKDKIDQNFILCINNTYKTVSKAIILSRSIPDFEFSSRKYHDHLINMTVYDIPLSIEDMYSAEYKRNVWNILMGFAKHYNEYLEEYPLEEEVPEVEEIVPVEMTIEESVEHIKEIIEDDKSTLINITALFQTVSKIRDEVEDLYQNLAKLKDYKEVQ